jgi:hypothetical protein
VDGRAGEGLFGRDAPCRSWTVDFLRVTMSMVRMVMAMTVLLVLSMLMILTAFEVVAMTVRMGMLVRGVGVSTVSMGVSFMPV